MPPISPAIPAGYNHDIPHLGKTYHAQTEYLRGKPPVIESHIFDSGQVVGCKRLTLTVQETADTETVIFAMKTQHKHLIRLLVANQFRSEPPLASPPVTHPSTAAGEAPQISKLLDLRHYLFRFTRAVEASSPPQTPEDIKLRLSSIVTSMAMLMGGGVFEGARTEELAELLILRSKAIAWFANAESSDVDTGIDLWSDLRDLTLTIELINQRKELIAHDLRIWQEALDTLETAGPASPIDKHLGLSLHLTWGRDLTLDTLCLEAAPRCSEVLQTLRCALPQLEKLAAPQPTSSISSTSYRADFPTKHVKA